MPDVSAKEQKIITLREKINNGVSADGLKPILLEITDILQGLQSQDEHLKETKQDKGSGVDGGPY